MGIRRFVCKLFKRKAKSISRTSSVTTNVSLRSNSTLTVYESTASPMAPSTAPSTPIATLKASMVRDTQIETAKPSYEEALATLKFVQKLPLEELGYDSETESELESNLVSPAPPRRYTGSNTDTFLKHRYASLQTLCHLAIDGSESHQDTLLSLLEQFPCAAPFHGICKCSAFSLGTDSFHARDLHPRELRLLNRAVTLLSLSLKSQEGLISSFDLSIFRAQFFPQRGKYPILTDSAFRAFVGKYVCRGVLSILDRERLVSLQPWGTYDDGEWGFGVEEGAVEPVDDVSGLVYMSEEEFEALPEWWEVEEEEEEKEDGDNVEVMGKGNGGWDRGLREMYLAVEPEQQDLGPVFDEAFEMAKEKETQAEFDALPHWHEVEDDPEYNVRVAKPRASAYFLPEYETEETKTSDVVLSSGVSEKTFQSSSSRYTLGSISTCTAETTPEHTRFSKVVNFEDTY